MADNDFMQRVFKLLDAVSETKRDYMASGEIEEKDYPAFLVNRGLSQHVDAVLYVNDVNCLPRLPARMQHDFYLCGLRPRRRRGKWAKSEEDEAAEAVQTLYSYRRTRAREAARVLRHDQVKKIIAQARELKKK